MSDDDKPPPEPLPTAEAVVTDLPDSLADVPPKAELGGAIGRTASTACKQGQHDLCPDRDVRESMVDLLGTAGCHCRCHERWEAMG